MEKQRRENRIELGFFLWLFVSTLIVIVSMNSSHRHFPWNTASLDSAYDFGILQVMMMLDVQCSLNFFFLFSGGTRNDTKKIDRFFLNWMDASYFTEMALIIL